MKVDEIIARAQEDFARLGKATVERVTGFSKTEEGWAITLEAVERKAIPDTMDVLGLYQVRVDDKGDILGFERKKLRKRGETRED